MKLAEGKAKDNLAELIHKFERELTSGKIHDYNEEATKTAFIQPLLRDVLGWDVSNRDEVSPEERVSRGRVDYGLKIEGQTKIFVEAKPPKADLKKHIEQAVSYGYNRKSVPFVLLTDFEDIKLFDVTIKPDARNLSKGLKIDLHYDEYLDKFDEIWKLSKESVLKGELDKQLLKKPKDRLPVDKAILDDLKKWREDLAKDIFKNNMSLFHAGDPEKNANFLKEITQRILDRIIFMRSCEDRKLVHRDSLKKLFEERTESVGKHAMVFLAHEFMHYNNIFDSDLFRPQEWEKDLIIDFKVIYDIIMETYNPYQFDVIPLEVLGNIYEQYLGYTIRLTDHQVKYELKPEVRKAGGIYYTPEYIVAYIVKNTVGKLLQELPAKKIKKLRILDPACGSGSFLIRAYEEMLNYYRSQKQLEPKHKKEQEKLDLEHEISPQLTVQEKSQILQEHIFGVDIDEQAVEVTKLSLMLKMLEGEFGIIPGRNILPMLDRNIRCGNSLISGDTLELKKYFGDDWYKVKAFNWNEEFRKIMVDEGGFDVVIGNPPYVLGRETFDDNTKKYLAMHYEAFMGKYDMYIYFTEKAIMLLGNKGRMGYILPNTLLVNVNATKLRKLILNSTTIKIIKTFQQRVFDKAQVESIILITQRGLTIDNNISVERDNKVIAVPQSSFIRFEDHRFNIFIDSHIENLLRKIVAVSIPLGELTDICIGIQLGGSSASKTKKSFLSDKQEDITYKQVLDGRDIARYQIAWPGVYVHYGKWLHRKRDEKYFLNPKIIMRQIGNSPIATFDENNYYTLNTIYNVINLSAYSLKYFLAIINGKLGKFFWTKSSSDFKTLFPKIKKSQIEDIPIRALELTKVHDKLMHEQIVALVDTMLDLHKKIQTAKGSEKEQIQKQIEKTDREIDGLVYKLYGITEKEREIIEGDKLI